MRVSALQCAALAASLLSAQTAFCEAADALELVSVTASGKSVPWQRVRGANLGSFPENISFNFRARTNSSACPIRIRYTLEGYENEWHDGPGEMLLMVRFYNAAGDQISVSNFKVSGESRGWNGSLDNSPLRHRRETVMVPDRAARLQAIISSAGPPATVGVYVVANLVVSKLSGDSPPQVLIQNPFENENAADINRVPFGWMRDGSHPSMAAIVRISQNPRRNAFAIIDDDNGSHAEWHNVRESAPGVTPGERLLVEWDEAFSMGVGDITAAHYQKLPESNYHFRVAGFDIFGNPTGANASVAVLVPPPFWKMSWFWSVIGASLFMAALGAGRYVVWHRMRREVLRLKSQQALELERLRIAQDLHDDFGARVTEISIASALAKTNPDFPATAGADFDRISNLSRALVSALYETVWAINPENDNLDALGNFLCQMANHLCEQAHLPCRLQGRDLPRSIEVSSQTRHNITMAVKEAVHNVIKHAGASELTLTIAYEDNELEVCIQDDGCGFAPSGERAGHGLINMKRRLADLGGTCDIESRLGSGTTVELRLRLPAANSNGNGKPARIVKSLRL